VVNPSVCDVMGAVAVVLVVVFVVVLVVVLVVLVVLVVVEASVPGDCPVSCAPAVPAETRSNPARPPTVARARQRERFSMSLPSVLHLALKGLEPPSASRCDRPPGPVN
jgi:hypothetical protein